MSISRVEEIIAVLWVIAALLAFNGGHQIIAVSLLIKAGLDLLCVIYFAWIAWKELKADAVQKVSKELQQ